jgi:hypothetical protein
MFRRCNGNKEAYKMNDPVHWIIQLWPIIVALVSLICALAVAYYRIGNNGDDIKENKKELKRLLFQEDGSLIYITRKEYLKKMEELTVQHKSDADNELTFKEHDKLCKIASLEMKEAVGVMLDKKFSEFEVRLYKQLKLNGFKHSEG